MDFSSEEAKDLAAVFTSMGVKPRVTSPEELQAWMLQYLSEQKRLPTQVTPESVSAPVAEDDEKDTSFAANAAGTIKVVMPQEKVGMSCYFSGGTKDTPYDLWRYEVDCLKEDVTSQSYSESQVHKAVRKSLRGDAARVAMRLGTKSSLTELLTKMDDLFGDRARRQQIMKEFYSASQGDGEDVLAWSYSLESILDRATKLGKVQEADRNEMLCDQFWTGLKPQYQTGTEHKFDNIKDFDKLRSEMRLVEQERNKRHATAKLPTAKASVAPPIITPPTKLEETLTSLDASVKKLNSRMDALEKDFGRLRTEDNQATDRTSAPPNRMPQNPYRNSGDRQKDVSCYYCHQKGHFKNDCPKLQKKQTLN